MLHGDYLCSPPLERAMTPTVNKSSSCATLPLNARFSSQTFRGTLLAEIKFIHSTQIAGVRRSKRGVHPMVPSLKARAVVFYNEIARTI